MKQGKRLWPKILLLLIVSALGLGVIELFLRRFLPVHETLLELDDRLLYRYRASSRKLFNDPRNHTGRVLVEINDEGRRGSLVDPAARHRVIVYGDSYIAGEFSTLPNTFVAQLEAKLKPRVTGSLQVLNAGIPGFGPDQVLLRMLDELDRVKPTLVVVAIYAANDYGDLLRNKIFKLDARQQLVTNAFVVEVPKPDDHWLGRRSPFQLVRIGEAAWKKIAQKLEHTTPAPSSVAPATTPPAPEINPYLLKRRSEFTNYVVESDNIVRDLHWDDFDADVAMEPESDSARYRRVLMERVLEKMQALAAARGIPFVVLAIPSPYEILDNYEWLQAGSPQDFKRSNLTAFLAQMTAAHDIPCVNFFPVFRQHTNRPSLYFPIDVIGHWNNAGQALAAEVTAEFLLQRKLVH